MRGKVIWTLKFILAAGLFFPLAYGTGVCLLVFSAYSLVPYAILAAGLGIYIAAVILIYRSGRNKHTAAESAPGKSGKDIKPAIIFFTSLAAVLALILSKGFIREKLIRMNAGRIYKAADEIVCYQNDCNTCADMLTTPLSKNSVLIDYDRMSASFIYHTDLDLMKQVKLKKQEDTDISAPVQFRYPLAERGRVLTVYGSGSETSGISVEMQNGSFWYADLGSSRLGFDKSAYRDIKQAADTADELAVYSPDGAVTVSGYSEDITRDTAGIDYDDMNVCLVYFSEGVAHSEIIPLDRNGTAPEGDVTAEIPFSKGTLRAYTAGSEQNRKNGRCDGFVFTDEEGTEWSSPKGKWGCYGLSNGRYAKI